MAFDPIIQMSLQAANGEYYYANQATDNTWTVGTTPTLTFLPDLPMGWSTCQITWERNMDYFGVFRAGSEEGLMYAGSSRAILLHILFSGTGGAKAYCLLKVHSFNEADFTYSVSYEAEIDFSTAKDNKQIKRLSADSLQGNIQELLKAKAGSSFNIPLWVYNEDDEVWETDATFVYHEGIKLLWKSKWVSGATPAVPLRFNTLNGFRKGEHGSAPNDGYHGVLSMTQIDETQNNGATTFIGNDILTPFLKQGSQKTGINVPFELNFAGGNESRPYTTSNFCLKDILPDTDGSLSGSIKMKFAVKGKFDGNIAVPTTNTGQYIACVLFEINGEDQATETSPGSGMWSYIEGIKINLPNTSGSYTPPDSGNFSNYDAPNDITLNYDKVYYFSVIWDNDSGTTDGLGFNFSDLEFILYSDSNSGTGSPVEAPMLPASVVAGYPMHTLWAKLVNLIDSTTTNAYGMPVETGVGYVGASDFLSDTGLDPATNFDNVPAFTIVCPENSLRNIVGIPYISTSIREFTDMVAKMQGCGMGIEGDNTLRIEPYAYFFDAVTEILALGTAVANFEVTLMTEIMANHISAGYSDPQLNNTFGCDVFCLPCEFDTPLIKTVKNLDWRIGDAMADQSYIEKGRVQNDSGSGSASASNSNVLLEIGGTDFEVVDVDPPSGSAQTVSAFTLLKYPTAQSTDPSAATDPYVYGLNYPDTAINLGLSPKRCMLRNGALLRSICDQCDTDVISFRKQWQQQYNNPTLPALSQSGISANLTTGFPIEEVADIEINDLAAQIFRPYMLEFDSEYSVNMRELINANPYGYISFISDGVLWKGFIFKAVQNLGNRASTHFQLIAHPDTTDEMLEKY